MIKNIIFKNLILFKNKIGPKPSPNEAKITVSFSRGSIF